MLVAIRRALVYFLALVSPLVAVSALGYFPGSRSGYSRLENLLLEATSVLLLVLAAFFETGIYFRELRSLVPKPVGSAVTFLGRLWLTLLGSAAVFVSSYLLLRGERWLLVPLAFPAGVLAYAVISCLLLCPREQLIRGRKYRSFREVFLLSKLENLSSRGRKIFWGGIHLPWASAVKHFLVMGATGAGKTMVIQLLMQSTLGAIGRGGDERGLIYDNKTELVPLLSALGVPFKIVHPFDKRGVALDLKSMVPTHSHSLEIASILVTQAKNVGTDPFWVDAPRNLLASVLTSLRLGVPSPEGKPVPVDWDFRDVVLIMQSQDRIREVITRHKETKNDIEGYFDDPRLLANVMASLKTQMMFYKPVAACWHGATERVNLTEAVWGREEYVLVLGNDEEFRRAINPINRVIITRYGQLALKRPRSSTRRIMIILDEFPDLKRLDPDLMSGLLCKGRSKGVCLVIGVQTLLSVVHEYGREIGKVIMSQCQNLAILGLGDLDTDTTDYAMQVLGQVEKYESQESEAFAGLFTKRTTREQLMSRSAVLASEFADLPETARGNGLSGFYRTRSIPGFWGAVLPGAFLEKELVEPDKSVAAIEERPAADHELAPWNDADLKRLGLTPEGEQAETGGETGRSSPQKPFRIYRGGKSAGARRATG